MLLYNTRIKVQCKNFSNSLRLLSVSKEEKYKNLVSPSLKIKNTSPKHQ